MTRRMSSDIVRRQIEKSLEILASSASEQQEYLKQKGFTQSVDELALELDDFVGMLSAAVEDGVLSEEQADAIRQLNRFTGSFSGEENAALWRMDQLGSAWQWNEVRQLARVALRMLRSADAKE